MAQVEYKNGISDYNEHGQHCPLIPGKTLSASDAASLSFMVSEFGLSGVLQLLGHIARENDQPLNGRILFRTSKELNDKEDGTENIF